MADKQTKLVLDLEERALVIKALLERESYHRNRADECSSAVGDRHLINAGRIRQVRIRLVNTPHE